MYVCIYGCFLIWFIEYAPVLSLLFHSVKPAMYIDFILSDCQILFIQWTHRTPSCAWLWAIPCLLAWFHFFSGLHVPRSCLLIESIWTMVWYSLPYVHVASSLWWNRFRHGLFIRNPVSTVEIFCVIYILDLTLAWSVGKYCLVAEAFWLAVHSRC